MPETAPERLNHHRGKNRLSKAAANLGSSLHARFIFGRHIKDPAYTSGLVEGSLINNPLHHPAGSDDETYWMETLEAPAGSWLSYEITGHKIFPRAYKKFERDFLGEGKLFAIILDEIKDNPADTLTPLGTLDPANFEHGLQIDAYTMPQLVAAGMVTQTTYGEAFEKTGYYDMFRDEMEARHIIDDMVYQVTPKGNTLIQLIPDEGDSEPRFDTQQENVWLPTGLAMDLS